jgi:hypothetical protein
VNQADSARLAQQMMAAYVRERGPGPNQENQRIQGAVFDQLFEFVPENAVAAMILRDQDEVPIIAVCDDRQLYLLEVFPEQDSMQQPETECRMIHVKPGTATVLVRTRYSGSRGAIAARSTTWRFEFSGGPTLTIDTRLDPDGEVEASEVLARALATALGWRMDLPAQGGSP